jgi:hypothetical protein
LRIFRKLSQAVFLTIVAGTSACSHRPEAARDHFSLSASDHSLPLHWHIGRIDPRFGVTSVQVRHAVDRAAALWNNAAGRRLFEYDDSSGFAVNLVYDQRQERENAEREASRNLETEKAALRQAKLRERQATAEFSSAQATFRQADQEFHSRLGEYNRRVDYWNSLGGATTDVVDALDGEKQSLAEEASTLDSNQQRLVALRDRANALVQEYNNEAKRYNAEVEDYNRRFAGGTQVVGEWRRKDDVEAVTVFAFGDLNHFEIVLAHELGHALGLGHAQGDGAIMSAVEKGRKSAADLRLTKRDKELLRQALQKE